jgi:hypothetical protein
MISLDLVSVVVIGVSSGFGSAFGVEIARFLVEYMKSLKIVKRNGS